MTRGDLARELVAKTLAEGLCISLPIPVRWRDRLVDAFFTFAFSAVDLVPYPAKDVRLVLWGGEVAIDDAFDLSSVAFDTSGDEPIGNWKVAYDLAYRYYTDAFAELAAGVVGPACRVYVEAVKAATLASQMPYYALLCPELFSAGAR